MAIMPLTYYYNPNIVSISMATVLGIIGGSVAGVARGLLSFDLIRDDMREKYFSISSVLYVFPYVIGIPLGALIAQNSGLQTLFFYLGLALILFVIPLYMLIIIWNHAKNKVQ